MPKVEIKFWGVRGSMASPGKRTVKYGGNTACVEISFGKTLIICDGGTGIRELGNNLIVENGKGPVSAHLLLSHVHLDHYIGLPFFRPFHKSSNRFVVAGPNTHGENFASAILAGINPPYFPISFKSLLAKIVLKPLRENPFKIGGILVTPMNMFHPGGSFGWRFDFPGGRSLVHVSDNEPSFGNHRQKLIRWMSDADILIHDAQFTPEMYKNRMGWGHSPYTYPIELAKEAGVKRVFLFHFDPADSDRHIKGVERSVKRLALKFGMGIRCTAAREGLSVTL